LRQAIKDHPDRLPRQLEHQQRKHLERVAEAEEGEQPHGAKQSGDDPAAGGLVADNLGNDHCTEADHQYQVHCPQDMEPGNGHFAFVSAPVARSSGCSG
jgi:hypothetical protein